MLQWLLNQKAAILVYILYLPYKMEFLKWSQTWIGIALTVSSNSTHSVKDVDPRRRIRWKNGHILQAIKLVPLIFYSYISCTVSVRTLPGIQIKLIVQHLLCRIRLANSKSLIETHLYILELGGIIVLSLHHSM